MRTNRKQIPAPRSKRQQRGAEVARSLIVEAAAALFARNGYGGTTIEEIARAAGYSPAAIYKHYKSKEDLFGQLWTAMADRLQQIFKEGTALAMPFGVRLHWVVTRLAQLLESNPDMIVAFLAQRPHVARRGQTELERVATRHYEAYQREVLAFVEQGVAEGVLRAGDAADLALLFSALMQAFAYKWVIADGQFDIPDNTRRLIALFLQGAGRAEGSGT